MFQRRAPTSTRMTEIKAVWSAIPRGAARLYGLRYAAARAALCVSILFAFAVPSAAQTANELVREGFAAKERRLYPYAIQLFDEALRRGEFAPEQRGFLLYSRGVSYEALGLRDLALGDLDAAIALLPQFPNSYVYRALIWTDRREFDLARDDLLQALRLNPDSALIRNNLGSVYERKGELDLAIENYGTAIRLDPAYAEAYYNRAHAFIAKQNYQAAVADYDRAIALRKDFADAYSNRGGVYLMQGDAETAIADFGEAIRLRESDPIFWANRANAYLALGRYKEAIGDFDRAQKLDPGNAAVYLGRGRAHLYSDAIAAAVEDLQIAVRLRPSNPNPVIWLHIARVHQGFADRQELEENTARVRRDRWPGAVLDLYLGTLEAGRVREHAEEGNAPAAKRLCEADFYIGEFLMHDGKTPDGREILQTVREKCRSADVVFSAAGAELSRTK
ncbi:MULTISPECIES: tetratricopeptide repeat protein [unclassified Bradyrhizobium]|uniref:tetratricopeptide repeat protein n=1 Tax=unclassified Bradyrhizobium TaxID=2631580 RepID=UPI001BAE1300|nr:MULTISPECIES: tetratricopeptide repeat protein [unclassified Bradyrhizobium]MBR1208154.1 tetratricopeptide repeat protein [Bradyrhizobium sp. AUGA SZCCT0124]MBR1316437.1 tetratricopeptide repeat protein [Bradyrhizobium sp. AUGA SZCCT0051]MBR1344668.1 tetratricopeptide repeat protein [Bradyrhizobium sp. AUGA SZCCT0105]MBR1359458.1 tetratricopeptide repeat protein [Bradyrhizobium sp. AUGA SZCCT0045]